jgi:response regulator NasT
MTQLSAAPSKSAMHPDDAPSPGTAIAPNAIVRVLIVDDSPGRTSVLREGLEAAGYEVAATLTSPLELLRAVDDKKPDVIIIETESPSRDVLEHVVLITRDQPRPIVMFSGDDAPDTIREAVRAGVSAYVVDGLDAARVKSIVEVAVARFDEHQRLRAELAEVNLKLAERKLVERAKGILMKARGMDEEEAFHALRRMAMDRGKRLAEIAKQVIDMADLLT